MDCRSHRVLSVGPVRHDVASTMSLGTCVYCRRPVTHRANGAIQVTGWMVNSSTSLKQKYETGKVAHRTCLGTEFDPSSQMNELFSEVK